MYKLKKVIKKLKTPKAYKAGLGYYRNTEWDNASSHFLKATEENPHHADSFFKLGMCHFRNESYSEAIDLIQAAINLDPSRLEWKSQLKQARRNLKKVTSLVTLRQEKLLRTKIDEDANNAEHYNKLAQLLRKENKFWQEIEALKSAIGIKDNNADWHFRLGQALEVMKRFKEAAHEYARAIELKPGNAEWYYRLGYAHESGGHDGPANPTRARIAYQQAIQHDGKLDSRRFGIGVFHQQRGYWEPAAIAYAEQVEQKVIDAELYYKLGMAHDRCYRWSAAAEAYQKAILLDDNKPYWHYRLALVFERMGELDNAAQSYEAAIEVNGEYQPYWLYRLGYVKDATANYKDACAAFLQTRQQQSLDPVDFAGAILTAVQSTDLVVNLVASDEEQAENVISALGKKAGFTRIYRWNCVDGVLGGRDEGHINITDPLVALNYFEELPENEKALFVLYDFDHYLNNPAVIRLLLKISQESQNREKALVVISPTRGPISNHLIEIVKIIEFPANFRVSSLFSHREDKSKFKINILKESLGRDTTRADLYYALGNEYEFISDWERAAEAYSAALARNDSHKSLWYYRLGFVLAAAGKYKEACKSYRETRILKRPEGLPVKEYDKDKRLQKVVNYTEYYENYPVRDEIILYESFHGNSMSCNPYAIFKYLIQKIEFSNWTHVWVINDKEKIPKKFLSLKNVVFVKRESDLYLRYLVQAKFLINNNTFPPYFIRKKTQKYLNTWHGTPLKTLGVDIGEGFYEHKNAARNFLHATHIISPNSHTTDVICKKHGIGPLYSGVVVETGYPRIDLTLNLDKLELGNIKDRLLIDDDSKVILYAPTYRGSSLGSKSTDFLVESEVVRLLSQKSNCRVLFRGHHEVEKSIASTLCGDFLVPNDIDTNELLSVVDVLITDYSSIAFDFIPSGKPIIYYTYDLEEYENDRGLYFSMDEMPGEKVENPEDLQMVVEKILLWKNVKFKNFSHARSKFCLHDDGQATKRVVDMLFDNNIDESLIVKRDHKKSLLLYGGPFIPNGITNSLINLVSHIDKSKYSVTLAIDPDAIGSVSDRKEQFERLPENVYSLARVGRMNLTLEEKWVIERFAAQHDFVSEEMWQIYKSAFHREFIRLYGVSTEIHATICFEGYQRFWLACFAASSSENSSRKVCYQHNDMYGEWLTRFFYLEGNFRLYKSYDTMVSVSRETKLLNEGKLSSVFNLDNERFVYCDNVVNPDGIISLADEPIIDQNEVELFETEGPVFVTMGRLSPEKDQAKLIRAFSRIHSERPDAKLLILGEGPLFDVLSQLVESLGLVGSVFLLGRRFNPFPFLKKADCFVFSSIYEGQGLVLLEAMMLGVPVVCTDFPPAHDVLRGGYGHIVENSEEGLINGMQMFLNGQLTFKKFDSRIYQDNALNMFYEKVCGDTQVIEKVCGDTQAIEKVW
jgi:CDP-glycerol glycerophosphotransferase